MTPRKRKRRNITIPDDVWFPAVEKFGVGNISNLIEFLLEYSLHVYAMCEYNQRTGEIKRFTDNKSD